MLLVNFVCNNSRGRKLVFLFFLGYLNADSQNTSVGFGDTCSSTLYGNHQYFNRCSCLAIVSGVSIYSNGLTFDLSVQCK